MRDLSNFERERIVGERLAGASVTRTATLLSVSRATVSIVMSAYTNHGIQHQQRRTVGENQNWQKEIVVH